MRNTEKMIEKTIGASRFANKATLKITPFEATMAERQTLGNLNWSNVQKSKSACLDERDQDTKNPADTNWDIRLDSEH